MRLFTKLKPNTLTIKRISCMLLSGMVMINQVNATNTNGDPDEEEDIVVSDSSDTVDDFTQDSLFLDDLFDHQGSDDLEEDDEEESDEEDNWTDILEDDIIEGETQEDSTFVWEDDEDDDDDWTQEDQEAFFAWLEENGFDSEEDYYAYMDAVASGEEEYDPALDYFGEDDEMNEGEEDLFLDWLEELGFIDADDELDEEEEDAFYAWLEEMGFEDAEDYAAYIDSLDQNNIEIDDDYDYFNLDEDEYEIIDMDELEEWDFEETEDFLDFVYELGFECVDDFFAYWYDIEDEWEYDVDDMDEELDPFDPEYDWAIEYEEEFYAWLEEMGFDNEEDYENYIDSLEENGIDIEEDFFFEDHQNQYYFEDQDYFEEEEEFYAFIESLGFESEEEFYDLIALLEAEYGHLGCDVDTTWLDDYDDMEEIGIEYGEETDCGTSFEFVTDSNYTVFEIMGDVHEVLWSFGDGDYSDEMSPTHEYEFSGTYEVCMMTYDSIEDCYANYCDLVDVLVEDEDLCEILITYYFDEDGFLIFDLEFDCYNRSEYDVFWQFGDLNTASTNSGSYGYANAGTYQVCATIRLKNGQILSTECKQVEVSRAASTSDEVASIQTFSKALMQTKLYPNPSDDKATFDFDLEDTRDMSFTITDIFGKVVYQSNERFYAGNNTIDFDVSQLPNGMYTLSLISGQNKMTQKFTVMH